MPHDDDRFPDAGRNIICASASGHVAKLPLRVPYQRGIQASVLIHLKSAQEPGGASLSLCPANRIKYHSAHTFEVTAGFQPVIRERVLSTHILTPSTFEDQVNGKFFSIHLGKVNGWKIAIANIITCVFPRQGMYCIRSQIEFFVAISVA